MPKLPVPARTPAFVAVVSPSGPPTPGKLPPEELAAALREAYKKQAAELLSIENSQQNLTILFLGIFSAGASFLASTKATLDTPARCGLTVVAVAILVLAAVYTFYRNRARQAVRGLLVACEQALGFFEPGVYLQVDPLYPAGYLNYPNTGHWLGWLGFTAVLIGGVGFLVILWSSRGPGIGALP